MKPQEAFTRHSITLQDAYETGERAFFQGKWVEALRTFDLVLRQEPNHVGALYAKAQALSGTNQFKEAIVVFDKTISLLPTGSRNEAITQAQKGDTLIEMQDFRAAEACIDRALSINPRLVAAWVAKARISAHKDRFEDSVEFCDRALTLQANNCGAWNTKAGALFRLGRFDECIECARQAIKLYPTYTMAHYHMAQAYKALGKNRRARKYDRKLQKLRRGKQTGLYIEPKSRGGQKRIFFG